MRNLRGRRRSSFDLRRITLGDYILVAASLLALLSLFMTWFNTSVPKPHGEWAFTYSEVAAVAVIVVFLATVFLILYPALSRDLGFPSLPFATPLFFLFMGALTLLLFSYELGKYDCIQCQGVSRGFGVWVAWVSSWVYIAGAIIKWGSRSSRVVAPGGVK